MSNLSNVIAIDTKSKAAAEPLTLVGFIASLLALDLREKLDAATGGDKSDARYDWGM